MAPHQLVKCSPQFCFPHTKPLALLFVFLIHIYTSLQAFRDWQGVLCSVDMHLFYWIFHKPRLLIQTDAPKHISTPGFYLNRGLTWLELEDTFLSHLCRRVFHLLKRQNHNIANHCFYSNRRIDPQKASHANWTPMLNQALKVTQAYSSKRLLMHLMPA